MVESSHAFRTAPQACIPTEVSVGYDPKMGDESTAPTAAGATERIVGTAIERGIATGLAALARPVTAEASPPPTAPRSDNRALAVATAALLLVAGQWAWNGRANTDRMNRLEDRVGGIETKTAHIDERHSKIERGQLQLIYATQAIANTVGADVHLPTE